MGVLLAANMKPAEAMKAFESAQAIFKKLVDDNPTVPAFRHGLAGSRHGLAGSHHAIGDLLSATGKPAEAVRSYESAIAIWQKLTQEYPEAPAYASELGGTLNQLARIDIEANRFDKARDRLREAIGWQRKAVALNPANPRYRRFLGIHFFNLLRAAQGLGDTEGAAEAERELVRAAQELVDMKGAAEAERELPKVPELLPAKEKAK
jgi:tetratricopeptide (TPR) repeat protein